MTELSRRERKKLETREKLFSSAMQLFCRQGFQETSIEQITQHADLGKGTFYNYFPSKESVVLEFSRRSYDNILASRSKGRFFSVRGRLQELLADWADFLIQYKELAWVALRNREGSEFETSLRYGLQAIITLGQREGEVSCEFDPIFLAETLEGMVIQHFLSWFVSGEGDLHKEMNDVISVLLDGLSERRKQA
ncbi:MAG: TetR/AcrR family transcriptional regulator [Desulfitobacterium hafniense]|nr:TetR/AcrR family transcriptional regulator [Desulfitobacterium hafniense]